MSAPAGPVQPYLPHVDGLRGLAVLAILLFHLDIAAFGGGFVGVDIFFVISGYLITSIIAREMQAGTFTFASFYARRIKRIFPALFVMLIGTSVAAFFFLGLDSYSSFFEAMRKASAQISNFYFARETDYFAEGHTHSPLLHTWSLGVEEQFYLLWPLLLLALRRSAIWLGVIAACSLILSEYLVCTDAMQAFYLLHARGWELAMGGLVALGAVPVLRRASLYPIIGLVGLILITGAVLLFDASNFPGIKALIPCLGAAMILYAGQAGGISSKILSAKPFVWTGLISYSLYLWHWPLVAFYKNYYGEAMGWGIQTLFFIASFALGYLSWRFVEKPCRALNTKPWKVITVGLLTVVLFIILGNVVKRFSDADWRVTYDVVEHVREAHDLDKICAADGGANDRDHCFIGPDKDAYQVILVGDSHASHYAPAILSWAAEKGLTVRLMLRGSCRTWIDDAGQARIRNGKLDQGCMDLTQDFYKVLADQKSVQYVFMALHTPSVEEADASLARIKGNHKKVIYLGQVPIFPENPHECQIRKSLLITKWLPRGEAERDCMAPDFAYSESILGPKMGPFRKSLGDLGIDYFDPVPFMKLPFDEKGRFMYLDSNHINRYGAAHLAGPLKSFITLVEQK